ALARVRLAALDTLGVMLAGAGEPAARAVRAVARAESGTPLATVIGTRLVTSPGWAALANGTAGHAHDFDDTNFALLGHPSVRRDARVGAQGELRLNDQALPRASRRAERDTQRPVSARRPDGLGHGARGQAGIRRRVRRRRAARAVTGRARPRLAAPHLGDRGQALPVVRPHPLGDRLTRRAARRSRADAARCDRRRTPR